MTGHPSFAVEASGEAETREAMVDRALGAFLSVGLSWPQPVPPMCLPFLSCPYNQDHPMKCRGFHSLGSAALWMGQMDHLNVRPGLGQDRGEAGLPGAESTLGAQS